MQSISAISHAWHIGRHAMRSVIRLPDDFTRRAKEILASGKEALIPLIIF
jgi:hypothetical protein